MRYEKKYQLLKKRNIELNKKLDETKFQLEFIKQRNSNGYKRAKELIAELEAVKVEWEQSLSEVNEVRDKYKKLVDDVMVMKLTMKKIMKKESLMKRFIKYMKQKIFWR